MTNAEFTEFVERYQRYVFTICFQLVRDRGEAQNLAQEAFLSAYRHIDSCAPEHYRPWLARIAANKAKDALKSAYHRRVQAPGDEEMDRLTRDLGPDELARCITYVDEAAQTTGNKNKWKDWNLVIRKCSKGRWGLERTSAPAGGTKKSATAAAPARPPATKGPSAW